MQKYITFSEAKHYVTVSRHLSSAVLILKQNAKKHCKDQSCLEEIKKIMLGWSTSDPMKLVVNIK